MHIFCFTLKKLNDCVKINLWNFRKKQTSTMYIAANKGFGTYKKIGDLIQRKTMSSLSIVCKKTLKNTY